REEMATLRAEADTEVGWTRFAEGWTPPGAPAPRRLIAPRLEPACRKPYRTSARELVQQRILRMSARPRRPVVEATEGRRIPAQ
ncbi:MAG TPA: hypothetical protein VN428_22580, partial [Bryobacteraceae bacterium]|nr:hypothetical protein [Bryobacteraceae bacterium]